MARTARTHRLTALAVRKYANDPRMTAPLHDGGGLYLRKRGASLTWVLRLTDPANGSQQWHRLFPDNPTGTYPHKSLADARQEAHRLWTTRSGGIDPRAERRRDIEARRTAESSRRAALESAHQHPCTIRALGRHRPGSASDGRRASLGSQGRWFLHPRAV